MIDLINAAFEGGGAILAWNNVRKLRRDQEIKGVYWPAQIWWSCWGLWNCYYYDAVGHPFSMVAGALLVAGNITWTAHAAWYARHPRIVAREGIEVDLEALSRGGKFVLLGEQGNITVTRTLKGEIEARLARFGENL